MTISNFILILFKYKNASEWYDEKKTPFEYFKELHLFKVKIISFSIPYGL